MFDNFKANKEKRKREEYLKRIYNMHLKRIGKSYSYPYELFLKNVQRSEKNEEIKKIYGQLIEKTYSQNENLKEYLGKFDEVFNYAFSVLIENGEQISGHDFNISKDNDKKKTIYKLAAGGASSKPFAEVNFEVNENGEIVSIQAKYTYGTGIQHVRDNPYDRYVINNVNEKKAIVDKEEVQYNSKNEKEYVSKETYEVSANSLTR